MKNYFNTILIASIFLLIFPFLGLPEFWENIYVVIFAFIVGYSSMLLRHKSGLVKPNDSDVSLQDYVKELQEKFAKKDSIPEPQEKKSRVSDIVLADDE